MIALRAALRIVGDLPATGWTRTPFNEERVAIIAGSPAMSVEADEVPWDISHTQTLAD
jgi:hypothetical protein